MEDNERKNALEKYKETMNQVQNSSQYMKP